LEIADSPALLKSEGKLSSLLVEAAFKQVPRHPFIDHFFLLETNQPVEKVIPQ